MTLQPDTFKSLVKAAAEQVIASAPRVDRARSGDRRRRPRAQHEARIRGGARRARCDCRKPLPEALKAIGKTLVMTVGGASGPLYGSLFMARGKRCRSRSRPRRSGRGLRQRSRGGERARQSQVGEKTMLDVLRSGSGCLKARPAGRMIARVRADASAADATAPMQATKGRASFLGDALDRPYGSGRAARARCCSTRSCKPLEGRQ